MIQYHRNHLHAHPPAWSLHNVLRALGLNDELAHSSLRITLGRFTTEQEIDKTCEQIRAAVNKLRELSPLWDMFKDSVDLSAVKWSAH